MIFFFTWEEKYLLDNTLLLWKKKFVEKYGSWNYYCFPENINNVDEIISALMWWWLFDEKKLIVIKWIPKDWLNKIATSDLNKLEKFITEHIDNLSQDNVIIFTSYKPDKRTKFYKFLSKHKNIELKEFKLLTEKKLNKYLQTTFNITEQLANYIIEKTWTNLYNIHNELEKIQKISPKITKELVDKYVTTNTEQDSFLLLDNFNNKRKTIEILEKIENNQEDFFKILWLLYWNLKNIILISEKKQEWLTAKEVASRLWIHPFVVSKIYKNNQDTKIYKWMFWKLIELDYKIKSWERSINLAYLYLKKIFLELK